MARPRARAISAQTQLRVGRLVKAHGLKGGLKVELYTDDPDRRFTPHASFALQVPDGSAWHGKRLELAELRWYNGHPVGFFVGVDDRSAAESLVKAILWVDQDPAEEAGDDAWWDHQLVGLDVVRDGETVGVIDRLEHMPAQDLLVVTVGEREVLVPFVRAIVPEVDIARHRVVVSPPQGLFEEDQAQGQTKDQAEAQKPQAQPAGDGGGGLGDDGPVVPGDPADEAGSEPAAEGSTAASGVPEPEPDSDADRAGEAKATEVAGIDVRAGEASDQER